MHACDSMAMLIGTAALSLSTTSAWPQALDITLRHRNRDRAQQHGTCAGRLYLKSAADGAFNDGRHAKPALAVQ